MRMTSGKRGAIAVAGKLALALAVVLALAVPARAQQTERARALGKRMLCVCGCNQILTECNHVGCTYSASMLKELDERVARNEPDDLTLQAFIQEYGEAVMAAPSTRGFNLAAWVMPVVIPIAGLLVVSVLVMRWRRKAAVATAPGISSDWLERARRETEGEE